MKVTITEQVGQVSTTKVFDGTTEEVKAALIASGYFSGSTGEKVTSEDFVKTKITWYGEDDKVTPQDLKCSWKPNNQPHKGKVFAEDGTELSVEYGNGVTYAEAAENKLKGYAVAKYIKTFFDALNPHQKEESLAQIVRNVCIEEIKKQSRAGGIL